MVKGLIFSYSNTKLCLLLVNQFSIKLYLILCSPCVKQAVFVTTELHIAYKNLI